MDNFTPLKLKKKEKVNTFLIVANSILVVIVAVLGIFTYNKTLITTEEKATEMMVYPSKTPTNIPTLIPTNIPTPTSSSSPTLTISPTPNITQKLIVTPILDQTQTSVEASLEATITP